MFTQKFLTVTVVAVLGCAVPASADIVGYTTTGSFAAATTADTFSDISFTQGNLGTSTSDLGVVFSSPGGLTGTTGTGLISSLGPGWVSGSALQTNTTGDTMTISVPAGVTAVSLYFGSDDTDFELTVTDNGGGSPDTLNFPESDSPVFVGLVTNSSFNTISIIDTDEGGKVGIDDMQIGGQTPEVATFLLVASGLLGMGYLRRRGERGLRRALEARNA